MVGEVAMGRWLVGLCVALALLAGCARADAGRRDQVDAPGADVPAATSETSAEGEDVNLVVAPSLQGEVDEALVRDAYRRAVAIGVRDFGIRPQRPVTIYVDPDTALG